MTSPTPRTRNDGATSGWLATPFGIGAIITAIALVIILIAAVLLGGDDESSESTPPPSSLAAPPTAPTTPPVTTTADTTTTTSTPLPTEVAGVAQAASSRWVAQIPSGWHHRAAGPADYFSPAELTADGGNRFTEVDFFTGDAETFNGALGRLRAETTHTMGPEESVTVDGQPAVRFERTWNASSDFPAGSRQTIYLVDLDGSLLYAAASEFTDTAAPEDYARNVGVLDAMMGSLDVLTDDELP